VSRDQRHTDLQARRPIIGLDFIETFPSNSVKMFLTHE
jgi:hypothetical protein